MLAAVWKVCLGLVYPVALFPFKGGRLTQLPVQPLSFLAFAKLELEAVSRAREMSPYLKEKTYEKGTEHVTR